MIPEDDLTLQDVEQLMVPIKPVQPSTEHLLPQRTKIEADIKNDYEKHNIYLQFAATKTESPALANMYTEASSAQAVRELSRDNSFSRRLDWILWRTVCRSLGELQKSRQVRAPIRGQRWSGSNLSKETCLLESTLRTKDLKVKQKAAEELSEQD
ncbi:hypothetical protein LTR37_003005 [Vermiconidia calcicola]|uniref:Uncharacterized protein n=1 Tax=Vermiconidia calcicola TaxID=1690605 RepID=A0ACC3NQM3_9PEZI|nr:hypothetical protein LTR37_003005 [Vermiconidia calcicola]